ncbi:hypothetical protein GC088_12790 [Arthrobacter sp. JZ12]|uniref:hypothetical protein n=1 Tax=Arthrobacter sp. JZ12 TaxID=2654190 RepID=UPI002B485CED|nr:hypothetical protein [Arthrobacter sp. JZ12]WRH25864.1 hypothetical protein GC088_12790 [Arthrobacter sp. JZ12]
MPDSDFDGLAETMLEGILQLFLFGAVTLGVLALAAATGVWLIVRRVRRSGVLRRRIDRGASRMRSFSTDPSSRELAKLRLQLENSTDATRRSLSAAGSQGYTVGDLSATAEDLTRAEAVLCERISLAEREPNKALRADLAKGISTQVNSLCELSAQLRRTLLEIHQVSGNSQLERATSRLSLEIGALQTWSAAYGTGTRRA